MKEDNLLIIEINNNNDVPLIDLTLSLLNVSHQYTRFLIRNGVDLGKSKSTLFIKQIISGSVIVELYPLIVFALPLIKEFNTVVEFLNHLKELKKYLLGSSKIKPAGIEKKDFEQVYEILNPTAKDHGSNLIFKAQDNATQNITLNFNSTEANAAQNAIKREIENMESEISNVQLKQLLRWFQVRFTENIENKSDKGIIENITKNPVRVIFNKDEIKQAMITTKGFNKPWQELAYIVDVEVLKSNDLPKVYKIIQYYPEDTFDPEE